MLEREFINLLSCGNTISITLIISNRIRIDINMIRERRHTIPILRHHLRCPNCIQIIHIDIIAVRPLNAEYPRLAGTAISRWRDGVGACCGLSATSQTW